MFLQSFHRITLIASLLIMATGCGRNRPGLNPAASLDAKLEWKLQDFREEFQIPALQLGLIKNGQVVFAGACGVKDLKANQPITSHSLFHMASVSKPFVAIATLQLVEQGRLKLDDRIVDHIPYFRLQDERYREITIRQVLAHTSGLPDLRDYGWDKPQWDEGAAERYVRSLANLKLRFVPGDRFHYSNIGYDILGDLIAKVSGVSFEAFLQKNVFHPLEMRESTFLKAEVSQELGVSPHRRDFSTFFLQRVASVYPYNRAHAPSSTLHSNVGDMLKFCQSLLQESKGAKVLSSENRNLMWTPQVDQGLRDPEKVEWVGQVGFGWFIGSYKGHRMISYSGADPGFRASVALLPEKGIAVVCMGNSDAMRVGRLSRAILDLALE